MIDRIVFLSFYAKSLVFLLLALCLSPRFVNADCNSCDLPTLFAWAGTQVQPRGNVFAEPLQTDRPDFTEASSTVGRGVLQLEMGYLYVEDENFGGERLSGHAYPNSLLRVGLFRDWFELRVGWTVLDESLRGQGIRESAVGSDDLQLGTKLALTQQCGLRPEMALILQMTLPTGSPEFTADKVLAGGILIYKLDLNDWCSVAGQTQLLGEVDDLGHDFNEFGQSAVVNLSLTEQWGTYVEWFGLMPDSAISPTAKPTYYMDGGFTYLVNDNLQLDILAILGLNEAAVDYGLGAGIAARF
ncbi:MAG: transporter [Pirellulaceae bacterium]|nr:transporter [Pirellulaceae bacterium]